MCATRPGFNFCLCWKLSSGPGYVLPLTYICRAPGLGCLRRVSHSLGWPQIHYVIETGLELMILLLPSLYCWVYRWAPPHRSEGLCLQSRNSWCYAAARLMAASSLSRSSDSLGVCLEPGSGVLVVTVFGKIPVKLHFTRRNGERAKDT